MKINSPYTGSRRRQAKETQVKNAAIQALDWIDAHIFQHGCIELPERFEGTWPDELFYWVAVRWNRLVCTRIAESGWWPEN